MRKVAPSRATVEYLLDGNVLVALADSAHVHHDAAVKWFASVAAPFATCPITQGTLIRMLLQFNAVADVAEAVATALIVAIHMRAGDQFHGRIIAAAVAIERFGIH